MNLTKILDGVDVLKTYGSIDIDINCIDYDSRNIKENGLFICIKGLTVNGHEFIESALKNGAKAFIVDENINIIEGYTFIKVKSSKKAMAHIASNFYANPSSKLNVLGVTGTNGKTSITTYLSQILNIKNKCGLMGTIKIDDGENEIISKNTTPESLDIQKYLNNMLKNDCKYCSMEVSSHSLALDRMDGVNVDVGIFTNLTEDHLDFHKNIDEYREVKERLFYMTRKANIINIDDEYGKIILNNIKSINTPYYTYGINNEADFMAKDIKMGPNGVCYTLITPSYVEDIFVPVPGKFTVYNTLAAIVACYVLGIPIEIIKSGLENSIGVEGRFELVKNNKNLNIIVDYAHTPDALNNILCSVNEFAKGKVITVFGCGGDRDSQKRPIMGSVAQENSDITIITTDNPRSEFPQNIINDILDGINKDLKNYFIIEDRKSAIEYAIKIAKEEDIVVIAGKGHETYQIIGKTKFDFDDRKIAKSIIDELEK